MKLSSLAVFQITLCWIAATAGGEVCTSQSCHEIATTIKNYMLESAPACDNFYKYACGNMLKDQKTLANLDEPYSMRLLGVKLEKQMEDIMKEEDNSDDPQFIKNVKSMYKMCIKDDGIQSQTFVDKTKALLVKAGGMPLLDNWQEHEWDFLKTEIQLMNIGASSGSLFRVYVDSDPRNPERQILTVDVADLIMSRDNLILGLDTIQMKNYASFMQDIASILFNGRITESEQKSKALELVQILAFEVDLAGAITDGTDYTTWEELTLKQLSERVSWIKWKEMLKQVMPETVTVEDDEPILVTDISFFDKLKPLVENNNKKLLANVMMWRALVEIMKSEAAPKEPGILDPKMKCTYAVATRLPIAVSYEYIRKHFTENTKNAAEEIADQIQQQLEKDIMEVEWMDSDAKNEAKEKVSKIKKIIGYSSGLNDLTFVTNHYQNLKLDQDTYMNMLLALSKWNKDKEFRQLREGGGNSWWQEGAFWGLGYYSLGENSLSFPAGMLQLPLFSADLPKYVTYAVLGHLIGHELTLSIYNDASRIDSDGKERDWWGMQTTNGFRQVGQCFREQYGNFKCSDSEAQMDGMSAVNKAVSDNGGMALAYRAYRAYKRQVTTDEPGLPDLNLSNDKLFWLASANAMCAHMESNYILELIYNGIVIPEFRVNGIVSNMKEFSDAFGCQSVDPMNPAKKCIVL